MSQLIKILFYYRISLVFLLLEFISGWLIIRNNSYQSAGMFVNANHFFAYIYDITNNVGNFINLRTQNEILQKENARLNGLLNQKQKSNTASLVALSQDFIAAKVIDNSILRSNNYIIIDKGLKDGIRPNMGVISSNGIVGKVKDCSENFSTIYSFLHSSLQISSRIKGSVGSSGLCSSKWTDTSNPYLADIVELPLYLKIKPKDTVVTSGFGGVFPGDYMIGTVLNVKDEPASGTRKIKIKLSTDFSHLTHVYVVKTFQKQELDSLTQVSTYE